MHKRWTWLVVFVRCKCVGLTFRSKRQSIPEFLIKRMVTFGKIKWGTFRGRNLGKNFSRENLEGKKIEKKIFEEKILRETKFGWKLFFSNEKIPKCLIHRPRGENIQLWPLQYCPVWCRFPFSIATPKRYFPFRRTQSIKGWRGLLSSNSNLTPSGPFETKNTVSVYQKD